MADLSSLAATPPQPGTPPPGAPPPQPPPQDGSTPPPQGVSKLASLAAQGTPQQTQQLNGQSDEPVSLGDYIHSYIQNVKARNAGGILSAMGQRVSDAATGVHQNIDRTFLTIEKLARDVDQKAGLYTNGHPLDAQIAHDEAVVNAPRPTDPERAGNVGVGDDAGSLMTYMLTHKFVQGMNPMAMLENFGPVGKVLKSSPYAARVLKEMVENGITGGTQAAAQGGDIGDVAQQAAVAAGSAGVMEAPSSLMDKAASIAGEVHPTTRTVEGVPFTQLASEAKGPEGQPLASKTAQHAAQYGSEPEIRYERQAAFKQMQSNLAKKGIGNAVDAANDAMASSNVSPDIQAAGVPGPTAQGQPPVATAWRYIPADGSTAMTAPETRAAMNDIKQRLLDKELTQGEEQQLTQSYDDMKDQLDRYGSFHASQPIQTHDTDSYVDATNSYGDAASHMKEIAKQQMAAAPPAMRQQYLALEARRDALQDDFDNARGQPNKQDEIMRNLDDANGRINDLFANKGTGQVPQSTAAMGDTTNSIRLSQAFQKLQNTMDRHFTLRADTAADINRPRVAKGLSSLSDHIEQVKSQYGDVLDRVLGKQGLNHITEMGDLMNQPKMADAPKDLMGNIGMVLRRHFQGMKGALAAGGGGMVLATMAGHAIGGATAGLGVLGTEAAYRMVVNRMATDPAFANRIIYSAKNNLSVRNMAPLLAALMTTDTRNQPEPPEDKSNAAAPSQ